MQILVILLHSLPIHFSVNSQGRVTVQIKWWPKFPCYFLSVAGGVKNFPSICVPEPFGSNQCILLPAWNVHAWQRPPLHALLAVSLRGCLVSSDVM